MRGISTCLWFDTQALEAAEHYCSLIPGSGVDDVVRYGETGPGPAGSVMLVRFHLGDARYGALNGGPQYTLTPAVSIVAVCDDQAEVDRLWSALLEGGGTEVQCGWLTDRFGVSWQVIPDGIESVLGDPDPERSARAMRAMFAMTKLDIDALRAAADGEPVGA